METKDVKVKAHVGGQGELSEPPSLLQAWPSGLGLQGNFPRILRCSHMTCAPLAAAWPWGQCHSSSKRWAYFRAAEACWESSPPRRLVTFGMSLPLPISHYKMECSSAGN